MTSSRELIAYNRNIKMRMTKAGRRRDQAGFAFKLMKETKLPAWCRVSSKPARREEALAGMGQSYECDARALYDDYRRLKSLRKSGGCSAQKYAELKHSLDAYKTALLAIRKTLRILM